MNDPIERIINKKNYNKAKKMRYARNFIEQCMRKYPTVKAY